MDMEYKLYCTTIVYLIVVEKTTTVAGVVFTAAAAATCDNIIKKEQTKESIMFNKEQEENKKEVFTTDYLLHFALQLTTINKLAHFSQIRTPSQRRSAITHEIAFLCIWRKSEYFDTGYYECFFVTLE